VIELFYWPTPNGHKVTLFLEEAGIPYRITRVDISKGEQFAPEFLRISPNNRMPAIIDHAPQDGGAPISVFESAAILLYLGEKTKQFLPQDTRGRALCTEWLFWQMAGLGPMTGQYGHFNVYAPEKITYAIDRYTREVERLLGVLDKRLATNEFLCGSHYTIADMACYPWIDPYTKAPIDLTPFVHVRRWRSAIAARPATARAYAQGDFHTPPAEISAQARAVLFGQPKNPL
jgi:GSH-dependent disulfide-bond oxidoreductase